MARRTCEDCGLKLDRGVSRTEVNGKLVCPACVQRPGGGRVTVDANLIRRRALLVQGMLPALVADLTDAEVMSMSRVAHDSGDGETIYHCPFCGGGDVVAGSDGTVECNFCNTHFTVQVQPEHNAMPQTINGVPVQMPGMPGDPTAVTPGTDPVPGADGGPPSTLNGQPKGTASPDAGGSSLNGKPKGGAPDGDKKPADGPKKPNPFEKKTKLYITTKGTALDEDTFIRHLAIRHADDRQSVVQQVREENTKEN